MWLWCGHTALGARVAGQTDQDHQSSQTLLKFDRDLVQTRQLLCRMSCNHPMWPRRLAPQRGAKSLHLSPKTACRPSSWNRVHVSQIHILDSFEITNRHHQSTAKAEDG